MQADSSELLSLHAVLNVSMEWGYPSDALSATRETVSFTLHDTSDMASARYFTELQENLSPQSALELRRSFMLSIRVPLEMCGKNSARRWVSDRIPVLLAKAATNFKSFFHTGHCAKFCAELIEHLVVEINFLRLCMQGSDGEKTSGAAMRTAGAATRALTYKAIGEDCSRKTIGIAKAIGAAAWADEATEYLLPALDALLAEVQTLIPQPVDNTRREEASLVVENSEKGFDDAPLPDVTPNWIDGISARADAYDQANSIVDGSNEMIIPGN